MAKNISIEISANNLGPHEALTSKHHLSALEIGILANNGSGKTFLSRAFRLATKKNLQPDDSNRLLTLGKGHGSFKLKILNSQEPGKVRELEMSIDKDETPTVTNNTEYIFRVFNEDYIKENLEISKFKPDGQIEGYILGKEKIDLSKEKGELQLLKQKMFSSETDFKQVISTSLKFLDGLGIRRNTIEYQQINYSNFFNDGFPVIEEKCFSDLLNEHNKLKSLPDNLPDLERIQPAVNTKTLYSIVAFLKEPFSKSSVAETFKEKFKKNQHFYELGLESLDKTKNECPFCEQQLTDNALSLIDKYLEYLSEVEAQKSKVANDLFSQLKSDMKILGDIYKNLIRIQNQYLGKRSFIPSIADRQFQQVVDIRSLESSYLIIKDALEKKKLDISASIESVEIIDAISTIEKWVTDFNAALYCSNILFEEYNNKKNNISLEKLELNRRLCRAKFLEIKTQGNDSIYHIRDLAEKIKNLEIDIFKKEQNEKVSKKIKVVETFELLLSRFFGPKYSFDSKTFCLKFRNELLQFNASDVLSTGEKSIVAFCYYLAETHTCIEHENDYGKLFFIVDDPISSQDFHYVYATAQIIRSLNKLFGINRLRLILLTHNLEFMSILIRNKIVEQKFVLNNGKIEQLGNELIMPYEEHLRDIYLISQGKKAPCHTTPNSLRHVLETINRFVAPNTELSSFCEKIEGFSDNEFLYSLMHDGSHGGIRLQTPYTETMIKAGCDIISSYISRDFSGQISIISA